MKRILAILLGGFVLMSAYAQDNLNQPSNIYPPASIESPQDRIDTEAVMSILKSIDDKGITDIKEKISFINASGQSNYIKDGARILITQGLKYSDFKKDFDGSYNLQKCSDADTAPNGRGGCKAQRSNVCCVN
jgi:hypothetical protein